MADTGREAIGSFFQKYRKATLRLAHKLGALYPEDAVQAAMVYWLSRKSTGRVDMACFERKLREVLRDDCQVPVWPTGREPRPEEVHGDIDRLVRRQHGGRVAPKKGAE